MGTIAIRTARTEDLPALLALWRELEAAQGAHRVYPLPPGVEEIVLASFRDTLGDRDARVLVADEGGDLVGMAIAWHARPSGLNAAHTVELSRVVVRVDRRGLGIGARLVEAAEDFGRERGARFASARIFTGNRDALRFWERHNFVPRYEQRVRPILDSKEVE